MKKRDFLLKLAHERRLQLIEPSSGAGAVYQKKSENRLESARLLLRNEHLEETIAMAYFSMYHATMALFSRAGIRCENTTALILLLGDLFEIDNTVIELAREERLDIQYSSDFNVTREDAEGLINAAESFNALIDDYIRQLTDADVSRYRTAMEALIGPEIIAH